MEVLYAAGRAQKPGMTQPKPHPKKKKKGIDALPLLSSTYVKRAARLTRPRYRKDRAASRHQQIQNPNSTSRQPPSSLSQAKLHPAAFFLFLPLSLPLLPV